MLSGKGIEAVRSNDSSSFNCNLGKWLEVMNAYLEGKHAYHTTMPSNLPTDIRLKNKLMPYIYILHVKFYVRATVSICLILLIVDWHYSPILVILVISYVTGFHPQIPRPLHLPPFSAMRQQVILFVRSACLLNRLS